MGFGGYSSRQGVKFTIQSVGSQIEFGVNGLSVRVVDAAVRL